MTERREEPFATGPEDAAIADAAATWFLLVRDGDLSTEQLSTWLQWLDQDPRHARAFDRIETAWHGTQGLASEPSLWPEPKAMADDAYDGTVSVATWRERGRADLRSSPAAAIDPMTEQSPQRGTATRRRAMVGLGLAAAIAMAAVISPQALQWLRDRQDPQPFVLETAFGENRTFELQDGSRVTVGGKSLLLVTLGPKRRDVALERGEAFFSVAKDPRRPFTVRAGRTNVTAVGTAFNVRRTGERIVVAVAEGVVNVTPEPVDLGPAEPSRPRTDTRIARLRAGERAIVEDGSSHATGIGRVDASQVGGWRDGRLQYDNEPLASVVADLSRYSRRRIEIGDPEVGALRITGTVFKDQDEAWLETLQAALPVRAVEASDGSVRLESTVRGDP